jgi:hypothetical protein
MAKMSIYVSDELKTRMDERPSENWSAIAQRAFELQLNSTMKVGNNMQAAIERLRASKAKIEEVERPTWIASGRSWAANDAEYEELQRAGSIGLDWYDDDTDRDGAQRVRELASAIFDDRSPHPTEISQVVEMLTGDENRRISGRQIGWFLEGVQQVWNEVKDEV